MDHFVLPDGYERGERALESPPDRMVEQGRLRLGYFTAPPRTMNLIDAGLLGGSTRSWWGAPRLMEWVGCGAAHADWYFGFIVVNAQSASFSALYGVNRRTGATFSHDRIGRSHRVQVAETTWDGRTTFETKGYRIDWSHRLESGFHQARIDISAQGRQPAVSGVLTFREDLTSLQPLVSCVPLGPRQFVFGHKAPMPIRGQLRVGKQDVVFDPARDVANLDEFKAVIPVSNRYTWMTCGSVSATGTIMGLNVLHNTHQKDPYWRENCLWVGRSLTLLDAVQFDVAPRALMEPWHIGSDAGQVDMVFHPEGGKKVTLGPLVQYHQKCGRFSGVVTDEAGRRHQMTEAVGCGEYVKVFSRTG